MKRDSFPMTDKQFDMGLIETKSESFARKYLTKIQYELEYQGLFIKDQVRYLLNKFSSKLPIYIYEYALTL